MQELSSLEIDLLRRRVLKMEPLNRRIVKMGFAKLQAIKRDSLPVIENFSPSKRYKTERSEERPYFNQFCEFTYEENQSSNSSIRVKKQIQPICIYKKPRIRENMFSFRKKLVPKIDSDKKFKGETLGNEFMSQSNTYLENSNVFGTNVSTIGLGQNELITFYPYKKDKL